LCEYYSSMLLDPVRALNGNNVFYHYRIPMFYGKMLRRILFPNVHRHYLPHSAFSKAADRLRVNPSWLVIAGRGHRLRAHLETMATVLGLNYVFKDCVDILGPNMSSTVQHLRTLLQSALQFSPLLLHLDSLHLFEFEARVHSFYNTTGKIKPVLPIVDVVREFMARCTQNHKVIVFGSASDINQITRELRALFTFEHVIESVVDEDGHCDSEIIPNALAPHLGALNLVNGLNTSQLFEVVHSVPFHEAMSDRKRVERYQEAIDRIRARQSLYNMNLNLNVSTIPSVKWADVGGLETAKQEILNIIQLPLKYSSLFASIKQSIGILLYGPPGTGKTLLAKAIATEFKMNFVSIKGPELLNPYVGQSEENIRNVFSKAVQSRPCILFFDEIDALVPSRGNASDGGNVMDRVVSQLLTEIDSVSNRFNGEIFIIAATNRPDLLDASLLRPKRLDKQIYLGIAEDAEDKLKIIRALTRKFEFAETDKMKRMDILRKIAGDERLQRFTGADLYALCCDAMMCCLKSLIEEIERLAEHGGDRLSVDLLMEMVENGERTKLAQKYGVRVSDEKWSRMSDFRVMLELSHFERALDSIKPSLTQREIQRYKSIHRSQNL